MTNLYLIGNWKQHGSRAAIQAFSKQWSFDANPGLRIAIAPPFPYLQALIEALPGCELAAQDCSVRAQGAYTGEVSADMLADLGCQFVLVGHSERRQYHDETDELIADKLAAAQSAGVTPVLCVGEQLAAREAGEHEDVVRGQLRAALATSQPNLLIAYEPVWAIGTGLTATPEQANEMHAMIKQEVESLFGASQATPILYGGSVNAENADALFACPHVDGALVGGASLEAASFMAIAQAASNNLSH
jgi:triosephosphate isomerase